MSDQRDSGLEEGLDEILAANLHNLLDDGGIDDAVVVAPTELPEGVRTAVDLRRVLVESIDQARLAVVGRRLNAWRNAIAEAVGRTLCSTETLALLQGLISALPTREEGVIALPDLPKLADLMHRAGIPVRSVEPLFAAPSDSSSNQIEDVFAMAAWSVFGDPDGAVELDERGSTYGMTALASLREVLWRSGADYLCGR